jgi:hypothetical protein
MNISDNSNLSEMNNYVKQMIALRTWTDNETIGRLAVDEDEIVRRAVASRPFPDRNSQCILANDSSASVKYDLLDNTDIVEDALILLSHNKNFPSYESAERKLKRVFGEKQNESLSIDSLIRRHCDSLARRIKGTLETPLSNQKIETLSSLEKARLALNEESDNLYILSEEENAIILLALLVNKSLPSDLKVKIEEKLPYWWRKISSIDNKEFIEYLIISSFYMDFYPPVSHRCSGIWVVINEYIKYGQDIKTKLILIDAMASTDTGLKETLKTKKDKEKQNILGPADVKSGLSFTDEGMIDIINTIDNKELKFSSDFEIFFNKENLKGKNAKLMFEQELKYSINKVKTFFLISEKKPGSVVFDSPAYGYFQYTIDYLSSLITKGNAKIPIDKRLFASFVSNGVYIHVKL